MRLRLRPLVPFCALGALSLPAWAQDAGSAATQELETVVVEGEIIYRDRTEATAPVLVYDLAYFQRFEPLTVGDMLKRVPSVAFVSDVLEYDGARLRGLAPGYTQVLINGKKVPGAGPDRSFFVDRIPAELVERIEIVRSPSANRSGDAVAGALNIVLRDAWSFDGTQIRFGGLRFDDGELKETLGLVNGGEVGGGRLIGGLNVQGRYNPKTKRSDRFESPDGDFTDREDQTDVRDGRDVSGNVSWQRELGAGQLELSGVYVRTDRTETEQSFEYNDVASVARNNLLSVNDQVVEIDQRNYSLRADYDLAVGAVEHGFSFSHSRFEEDRFDTEIEIETGFDDDDTPPSFDEREGSRVIGRIDDRELQASYAWKQPLAGVTFEWGVDGQDKRRDDDLATSEVDTDEEGAPLPPFVEFDVQRSRIEERRIDPYLMVSGQQDDWRWEAGLRYERTEVQVNANGLRQDNDYSGLLPSLHLSWDLSDTDRLRLSLARTVRRPDFNLILPLGLEEEFGDNDFVGNPQLAPEFARGIDVGFERRLGRNGVVGLNLFYRDVSDLIEVVNTGEPSATALDDYEDELDEFLDENPGALPGSPGYPEFDPDSFVYSAANVGDGRVYGVEFDLSTPLDVIGLPNTGWFTNYAWLDSEVDDALGERRFNDQARFVYNLGFIHEMPEAGVSFGVSYRKQGDADARLLAEEVSTRYGADLEAFIEKRFGKDFTLRLTGSNLLNASKDEVFDKFDTLADQIDRDHDEYELETESAGAVVQLVGRYTFR